MNLFRAVIESENVKIEPIRKFVLTKIPGDTPLEEELVNELPIITGTLFVLVDKIIKSPPPEGQKCLSRAH